MTRIAAGSLVLVAMFTGLITFDVYGQSSPLNKEVDLRPVPNIDQRLFLVHYVLDTYENWPEQPTSAWVLERRLLTQRLYEHIKKAELGGDLVELYADCLHQFKAEQNYLEDIGAVERGLIDQTFTDRAGAASTTALGAGLEVGRQMFNGATFSTAARSSLPGLGIAVAVAVVGELFASAERNQLRRDSLARFKARYEKVQAESQRRAAISVQKLTSVHRWTVGEAGFDGFQAKRIDEPLRRRPRDAFYRARFSQHRVPNETGEMLLNDARRCVLAARMVPTNDPIYDVFRATFLRSASYLASKAASRHWFEQGLAYPVTEAVEAVQICRTRLRLDPTTEADGEFRLAQALNFAGKHDEALSHARKASVKLATDPGFMYDFACILSLNNRHDEALVWLKKHFQIDSSGVAWARKDPDLAGLRKAKADAFNKVAWPTARFIETLGYTYDQVKITNTSPFALTNTTLHITITNGDKKWTKALTVRHLAPGKAHTWSLNFQEITVRDEKRTRSAYLSGDQIPYTPEVTVVASGSAAEKAGLKPGDQILSFNGVTLIEHSNERSTLLNKLLPRAKNSRAILGVMRNNVAVPLPITVPETGLLGINYLMK